MDERSLQFINWIFYQDVKKIKTPDAGKFCEEFCLIFSEFIFTTFGFLCVLSPENTIITRKQEKFLCRSVVRSRQTFASRKLRLK